MLNALRRRPREECTSALSMFVCVCVYSYVSYGKRRDFSHTCAQRLLYTMYCGAKEKQKKNIYNFDVCLPGVITANNTMFFFSYAEVWITILMR
jgi:hypothetical protein